MTRLIGWLAGVVSEPHDHAEPHFHSGPATTPVACFDAHCGSPRLDI